MKQFLTIVVLAVLNIVQAVMRINEKELSHAAPLANAKCLDTLKSMDATMQYQRTVIANQDEAITKGQATLARTVAAMENQGKALTASTKELKEQGRVLKLASDAYTNCSNMLVTQGGKK